jgi:hypothetical protein
MRDGQSSNGTKAPVGPSHLDVTAFELPPTDNDAGFRTLEEKFDELIAELLAVQRASGEFAICLDHGPLVVDSLKDAGHADATPEARTKQVEAILARLYPIEQAIMQTPARTITGLAVKARHAAYVMSQYWEVPIDRIDWDARAARLLIEAVCNVARVPLPLCEATPDMEA